MGDYFVCFDKFNSVAFQCFPITSFYYMNNNYLIYYVYSDSSNCKVYASRLLINNGVYNLSDLSNEEKSILNELVYKIVISFPSSYNRDININDYINNFSRDNNIIFSSVIPKLGEQLLYYNSFFANSDIKYISSVKSFYKYVFSVVGSSNSLVWSIPKPVFSNLNSNNVNNDLKKLDVVFPFGIASNNNKIESVNNSNSNSFNNTSNNLFNFQAPKDISINNTKFDDNNDNSLNILSADFNISNDSYLNGFNKNNSLSENAGFASNHYIIIGTVCLILASIIVAVSIFIIKNL